jgi:hypothetical protein
MVVIIIDALRFDMVEYVSILFEVLSAALVVSHHFRTLSLFPQHPLPAPTAEGENVSLACIQAYTPWSLICLAYFPLWC